MRIDIHCHAIGNGQDIDNVDNDVFFKPGDNNLWITRVLYSLIENEIKQAGGDRNRDGVVTANEYFDLVYQQHMESTEVDGIVLLALDALFDPDSGALDTIKTDLWISNRYLANKVRELNDRIQEKASDLQRKAKRFFFGASVSPNRIDWEGELAFVLEQTDAVLLKLIPSVQHIRLQDQKHKKFFETLARQRMPLLCHVGPEYSFPEGIRHKEMDDFRLLDLALSRGVTVIAAHCAAPVFPLIDPNEMKQFFSLMQKANSGHKVQLWADTSALSLATRLPFISEIVKTFPAEWLVHGTDFPVPIDSWPHLPLITYDVNPRQYAELVKTRNPFDRDVRIKRAHGFSDAILTNAEKVLRMPHAHGAGFKGGVNEAKASSNPAEKDDQ